MADFKARSGLNLFPDAVVTISLPDRDLIKLGAIGGADDDRYTKRNLLMVSAFHRPKQVRFIVKMLAPTSLGTEGTG